ncbi:type II CRISPR RNA-guided endonuclease Cas9 [Alkalihalobacillus pseudalcaliphilus]|uniref:type II CRISPR RNA-guided endonuclease Cas9 n=1 Tax=Alkalihalobacillus pseudalcaliphilus TaxID=79884 RepID=UPI00064DCC9B|nr:type II CRISPR RNA-guided endonuclease Cas9 [Alkalihalobacillus pseudalcaliphilus]KMK77873.1 hypothetical protein AB990_04410 [Alkalihalobacillus pseudalcaliphilus]
MDYRIGLDIGTNSIGWSIIELTTVQSKLDGKYRLKAVGLIDAGVRMFDRAEVPKTGASLALPRRLARSSRRRLTRRSARKKAIRNLLVKEDILNQIELDHLYRTSELVDIWQIRVEGLERRLGRQEWARLLIHLGQKRGYRSTRKAEEGADTEGRAVLSSIKENQETLKQYRTVGEMWATDDKFKGRVRNSTNEFIFNVSRDNLEEEIRFLFQQQRELGSMYASKLLEESYMEVWGHQLPFASGESILKNVGTCSLYEKEKRAAKATYTFQYFMALDKLNNVRILPSMRTLSEEERGLALKAMFERDKLPKNPPKFTYSHLRKAIKLEEDETFQTISYDVEKTLATNESAVFVNLAAYYQIKKVCDEHNENYDYVDYNTIGHALTVYKTDEDINKYLASKNNIAKRVYANDFIDSVLKHSYTTFGHLSLKALSRIIPLMEEGEVFAKAKEKAGFKEESYLEIKSKLLTNIPDAIKNPVVMRSLTQARKVINAIIKRMGEQPASIQIELARELSKDVSERKKITNGFAENRSRNQFAIKTLEENHITNIRGQDIVKFKLWQEQGGRCAYSLKPIKLEELISFLKKERRYEHNLDVDHIIPYSKTFDDSYTNKVLVFSDENRKKGDQIPAEYLGIGTKRWEKYKEFVITSKFPASKKKRLLKEQLVEREELFMKERHLNDTRYASRYFMNFLRENLLRKETVLHETQWVTAVAGRVTSHIRKRLGFGKDREETHLHHALDAIIVACTDKWMIDCVTNYYKSREGGSIKRKEIRFPSPWNGFWHDVQTKLAQLPQPEVINESISKGNPDAVDYMLVSRMPRKSITGAAHKETISKWGGYDDKGKALLVKKVALSELKFKNDDFPMYNKETDPLLYEAIKNRYVESGRDVKRAFATPLYKPSKSGKRNEVKRVKVIAEKKAMVREVNGGIAENGGLVRSDIFLKEKKYVMVPVYTFDTIKQQLPNKYVVSGRGYEQWPELTAEHVFQFSVYPYELVHVGTNKGDNSFYYFASLNISSNVLKFSECNRPTKDYIEIGLNSIILLEKYEIDVLGRITGQSKKGIRQSFKNNKSQMKE